MVKIILSAQNEKLQKCALIKWILFFRKFALFLFALHAVDENGLPIQESEKIDVRIKN